MPLPLGDIKRHIVQGGRTVVDLPFFRKQSYQALNRQDAVQWFDLGTY
jgi:hypothetical protein